MGPHEVVIVPPFEVAHGPPEPRLEGGADQDGVIAFADVVLVRGERGGWKWLVVVVLLVNLSQE